MTKKIRTLLWGIGALMVAAAVVIVPTELGNGSPVGPAPTTSPVGLQGVVAGLAAVTPTPTPTVNPLCAGPAPVTPAPEGLTGEHWVDVSISQQLTTLYIGDTPIQQFCVSTGIPGVHDTPQGTFKVYRKWAVTELRSNVPGAVFDYPNVKWVDAFDGPYYFHTAYWHNDFGTPVSHGCVNLREADAKVLYDFVTIGTRVVVHE